MDSLIKGGCLCGAVSFTVEHPSDKATACHCTQCRKQSGSYWISDQAPMSRFSINGRVQWYEASETAKRGFCPTCGSFLFWKAHDEEMMSFSLGAIDGPSGRRLKRHIFTEFKGDYYDIPEDPMQGTGG